ncbi:hypothetical protein DKX38_001977 [Salix brachista]|uniref:Uncharacterized protein n=1 Tax=Salix brachista TaxID=2182728 RepID=A0A5N5NKX9_9ROSI|nr:hypothetical protein DKX38_001977 [Salix brachista]
MLRNCILLEWSDVDDDGHWANDVIQRTRATWMWADGLRRAESALQNLKEDDEQGGQERRMKKMKCLFGWSGNYRFLSCVVVAGEAIFRFEFVAISDPRSTEHRADASLDAILRGRAEAWKTLAMEIHSNPE